MKQPLILFLLISIPTSFFADAQTLLYSVSLQTYGCPAAELTPFTRESELSAGMQHISFDRTGKVFVGCAIQGDAKLLKPGEGNNIFRVLTIDAESGAVSRKLDFPTQSKERTGINISANNSLLVTANDKVQLLGDERTARATFDIPIDGEKQELGIDESVSGKTLLVSIFGAKGFDLRFFHADTLSLMTHCEIPTYGRDFPNTIADHVQMTEFRNDYVKGGPMPWRRLVVGPLCGPTRDLWEDDAVGPFLLDDSTVLERGTRGSSGSASGFVVRKINGETLCSVEFPKGIAMVGLVRAAQDGSRFAMQVGQFRGGHPALDIGAKMVGAWIWIYDTKTGKRVGSIPVSADGRLRYALSPKGDKVAILSPDGGTLEVWKL
jgi:hypothetical protein